METIIAQELENLKRELLNFFSGEEKTLKEAESKLSQLVAQTTSDLLSSYYETIDQKIYNNKKWRKEKNLVVERRNDKREILTVLGTVRVKRTYYQTHNKEYVYPLDEIMDIESYQRVSGETCTALVNTAIHESYARSSELITNRVVSKQTVMNKIRKSYPVYRYSSEKRRVPILHIDADEDHIKLQTGKSTIVPLLTVYEGIDRTSKRHKCINAFNIGEYGSDTIWEKAYDMVNRIYDLEDTTIYIHGDGAPWIKKGLEWFDEAIFVLDPYHKNKALKQSTANMKIDECKKYQNSLDECLKNGNHEKFLEIQAEMCETYPEMADNILRYTGYLYENIDSIVVRYDDEDAKNGGATEPHISHGLSARLSSRPKGWSSETLKHFVPILAAKEASFERPTFNTVTYCPDKIPSKVGTKIKPNTIGLVNPDSAVSIANSISGSTSHYYKLFRAIWD